MMGRIGQDQGQLFYSFNRSENNAAPARRGPTQSRGVFELLGQACSSSSSAFASFRSSVSKPSVN
jgi:hypothetical protein